MTENVTQLAGFGALSNESRERLERLSQLLQKWNPAINLVAQSTLSDVWGRHIADSAQLFTLLPSGAKTWLDLGSGGGFPGLVVAILATEQAPDLQVELVESDQRKCVFLQTAVQTLRLSVTVTRSRIEALAPRRADVVSARALARLDRLCGYALPHLAPKGICLFLKGGAIAAEVEDARRHFQFDVTLVPSSVDSGRFVVKIADLAHV